MLETDELLLGEKFLRDGHVIVPAEDVDGLTRIRDLVASETRAFAGIADDVPAEHLLNHIHRQLPMRDLNALRLKVISALRTAEWFRPTYFRLVRAALFELVGNELAMQRGIGLSVQLPADDSSLLAIHADTWDGDSPYEVVVWVPLVDCFRTKSMYLVPPAADREVQARLAEFQDQGAEALYHAVADDARFLDVPFGSVLIFSQTLMHGNRVNREDETRWSMNCRFKSVMSPYADKRLGEFFEPITLRPATRIGMGYRLPGGFSE